MRQISLCIVALLTFAACGPSNTPSGESDVAGSPTGVATSQEAPSVTPSTTPKAPRPVTASPVVSALGSSLKIGEIFSVPDLGTMGVQSTTRSPRGSFVATIQICNKSSKYALLTSPWAWLADDSAGKTYKFNPLDTDVVSPFIAQDEKIAAGSCHSGNVLFTGTRGVEIQKIRYADTLYFAGKDPKDNKFYTVEWLLNS